MNAPHPINQERLRDPILVSYSNRRLCFEYRRW
jgi:hypothetical protein